MTTKQTNFLKLFPDHIFRYLDRTGNGRFAVKSDVLREDLNIDGFCSYFTVNGFANFKNNKSGEEENLTSINGFWVDIDGRKDTDELTDIRKMLDPTAIIETGHGHHIQIGRAHV